MKGGIRANRSDRLHRPQPLPENPTLGPIAAPATGRVLPADHPPIVTPRPLLPCRALARPSMPPSPLSHVRQISKRPQSHPPTHPQPCDQTRPNATSSQKRVFTPAHLNPPLPASRCLPDTVLQNATTCYNFSIRLL